VSPPLLVVDRISKSFGGVRALIDVSLSVAPGEKIALIGPNGAGKTTLFNILDGQLTPDRGSVALQGKRLDGLPAHAIARLGIGRTFQITATFGSMTVSENVLVALLSHRRRLHSLLARVHAMDDPDARALLARVGIAALGARQCATLAYGDLKRVELAIALAGAPCLLLMDEPTAGMPPAEREQLMQNVARVAREDGAAVLFTEHDMDVVFKHADRIIVLNRGRVIASGSPGDVRADSRVREAYLGTDDAAHRPDDA
jgi:branched-chain amino acid transport system ATP-binding protein